LIVKKIVQKFENDNGGTKKMANVRIQNKSDKQVNWEKAINFVPLKGEIIIYEKDENYLYDRIKLGNGITKVNDLPFIDEHILT
jgi:hypothetical protein